MTFLRTSTLGLAISALLISPQAVQAQSPTGPQVHEVSVELYAVDVLAINDAARTANVDMLVRLSWSDPQQAGLSAEPRQVATTQLWTPEIGVMNDVDLQRRRREIVEITPDGTATYLQRYVGTVSTKTDLSDFPYDSHTLEIEFVSAHLGQMEFLEADDAFWRAEQFSIPNWEVTDARMEIRPTTTLPAPYPAFALLLDVARESSFFFYKILIPLSLVTMMSWASFFIDPGQVAPQVGISATSMLTLIAYRFVLGNLVPQLGYLTRLDQFLLGATILVFLALAESLFTAALGVSGDEQKKEAARRVDRVCRVAFPVAFVAICVKAFVP